MLAGLLVALAACWAVYLMNRLWQQSLAEEVGPALAAAQARGFVLEEPGLRARIVAVLGQGPQATRIEWRGGLLGPRTVLISPQARAELPLIRDEVALMEALGPGATPAG